MKVAKWGNSLAIRLPANVVEALGLKEGDEIEIHVADANQLDVAGRNYGTRASISGCSTMLSRAVASFREPTKIAGVAPRLTATCSTFAGM